MGSICGPTSIQLPQQSGPPPEVMQNYRDLVNQAKTASANLPGLPGPPVAPLTQQQLGGINNVDLTTGMAAPYFAAGLAGLNTGLGTVADAGKYIPQAAGMIGAGAGYYGTGADMATEGAGNVTPMGFSNEALQQYMSPYTQNVIDSTMANIQRTNDIQQNNLRGSAILGGNAFGGDRAGIAAAELARNQDMASNQTMANLWNQNYSQALGEFNTQQGVDLQAQENNRARQLQAAGIYGSFGQGMGALGGQYGNLASAQGGLGATQGNLSGTIAGLGSQATNTALASALAQIQAGGIAQGTYQNQANSDYQSLINSLGLSVPGYLAPFVLGAGAQSGTEGYTTQAGPSLLTQVGGILAGVTGLAKGKLGNSGGRINGYDDGGAVDGAGGGYNLGDMEAANAMVRDFLEAQQANQHAANLQQGIGFAEGGSTIPGFAGLNLEGFNGAPLPIYRAGLAGLFSNHMPVAGRRDSSHPSAPPPQLPNEGIELGDDLKKLAPWMRDKLLSSDEPGKPLSLAPEGYAPGGMVSPFINGQGMGGGPQVMPQIGGMPGMAPFAGAGHGYGPQVGEQGGGYMPQMQGLSGLPGLGGLAGPRSGSGRVFQSRGYADEPLSFDSRSGSGNAFDPADFGEPDELPAETSRAFKSYGTRRIGEMNAPPPPPVIDAEDIVLRNQPPPGTQVEYDNPALAADRTLDGPAGVKTVSYRAPVQPPDTADTPMRSAAPSRDRRAIDEITTPSAPPVPLAPPGLGGLDESSSTKGKVDPWLALAAFGFGTAAGNSPWFGVNIGRGGLAAVQNIADQREQTRQDMTVANRAKQLEEQAARWRATLAQQTARDESTMGHQLAMEKNATDAQQRLSEQHEVPSGYRRTKQGGLEPVPGGPKDPETIQREAKAKMISALSDSAREVKARQLLNGDTSGLINVGRGAQGSAELAAISNKGSEILIQEMGYSPQEAADHMSRKIQEYKAASVGANQEARTTATREAGLKLIIKAADAAIPAALEASDEVARTGWVPINKLVQKGEAIASSGPLKVFGMANLQLAEHWARAMNPTGVLRESDRDKALDFLNTTDSKETYRLAVMQLKKQIDREYDAIRSGKPGTAEGAAKLPTSAKLPVFENADAVRAAKKAGKIKSGDSFVDDTGIERKVP